jgi:hypothetical protein
MTPAEEVEKKLSVHEAVCAERYLGIFSRMKRMESILVTAAGTIIMFLAAIAWKVAQT